MPQFGYVQGERGDFRHQKAPDIAFRQPRSWNRLCAGSRFGRSLPLFVRATGDPSSDKQRDCAGLARISQRKR